MEYFHSNNQLISYILNRMTELLAFIVIASVLVIGFFSWFGKADREIRDKKRAERQARIYARKVYEAFNKHNTKEAYDCINEYTETEYRQEQPKEERKTFDRKKIITLLKKLRELALRGVGGEKENAKRMFYEILNKYGIKESELA